jgi:hypothetical protein
MDTFLAGSSNPWQLFINCDLVAGLLLMVAWIVFRERGSKPLQTIAWVWMALWWGNVVVAAYVLRATRESSGDWALFFMGRNAPGAILQPPIAAKPLAVRMLLLLVAAGTTIYVLAAMRGVAFAPLPTFGYVAGFAPIVLTLLLLGLDHQTSVLGHSLSRTH